MKTCPTCRSTYPGDFSLCPRDGTPLAEAGVWSEGTVLRGKYRILAKVGQGGMGAVYKALHLRFDEVRALKVLSAELASDPLFVKRFEQEAVVTRKLQHPNAVRIDDIDEAEDGRPFIVMEFIEGRSLKKVIEEEGPLPVGRTCAIIKQVAAALDAAHRLGMVHRDIKPDNIALVSSGEPGRGTPWRAPTDEIAKVLDFGIAKVKEARLGAAPGATLTKTGVVIGTPQYMSPEQATGKRGDDLDGRSDLYSLGIVMYQMLTRQLPFKADTTLELLLAHMQQPPTPIRALRPDLEIPEPIATVVMRCLEKKREQRPATAQALIEDLDRAESVGAGLAPPREPAIPLAPTRRVTTPTATPAPPARPAPHGAGPRPVPAPAPKVERAAGPTPAAPSRSGQLRSGLVGLLAGLIVLGLLSVGVWYFSTRPGEAPTSPAGPAVTIPQQQPTQQPQSKPETQPATESQPAQRPAKQPASASAKRVPERPPRSATDSAEATKNVKAALTEGDFYYSNGEYDNAIAAYQKGLDVEPANAQLRQKIQKARNAKAAEGTVNQ